MVECYCGTCGSGKSLHCAEIIYKSLYDGHCVIANFHINLDFLTKKREKNKSNFYYVDNLQLKYPFKVQDFIIDFFSNPSNKKKRVYLFLDECQILFDSRQWNITGRTDWLNFFAQHRKFNAISSQDNIHLCLITQNMDTLDKRIRGLIEYRVEHACISNFGNIGLIVKLILNRNLFRANTYWNIARGNSGRVYGQTYIPRKKYYSIYDTLNKFDDKGVNEN